MLTAEQIAIRATGIGASEVAALFELAPYSGPLDVWMSKPTPQRPPLVTSHESLQSEVGSVLEAAVLQLYTRRTGREVTQPHTTLRHAEHSHVLGSPDAIVEGEARGVEVKVVGHRMLHHWESDSVPDYYSLQCHQLMAVLDVPRWDLVALLGGTDLRIVTIERDAEIEASILETVEAFWSDYIETSTPPPPSSLDERKRYLRTRYPGSGATRCEEVEADDRLSAMLEAYHRAHETERAWKEAAQRATLDLVELVGDRCGLQGPWGKFIAPSTKGRVDWRALAEEIAGGTIPADMIERHRGESYRMPRFYPPAEAGTKKGR